MSQHEKPRAGERPRAAGRSGLAHEFERQRPYLRRVAYRMLGSLAEANDAVQETWLRVDRAGADEIENLGGWLTTIVARVCLNMLRTSKSSTTACHRPSAWRSCSTTCSSCPSRRSPTWSVGPLWRRDSS
jgi:DNA-directed RNA polymerase specialized sigma24 family protein